MALINTLVQPGVPSALQAQRVFERSLIASLASSDGATSVGFNMRSIKLSASMVRERLSEEHWNIIVRAESEFFARCARHADRGEYTSEAALHVLKSASDHLAAITGAQTDRMTRDDGWRLLSIGRHVERLVFLCNALAGGVEARAIFQDGGFEGMLALFDSTITFHAQYQQSRDLAAMVDLLVLDRDNPRSLAWVTHTLRGRLARLAGEPAGVLGTLSLSLPDPQVWQLERLCEVPQGQSVPPALLELMKQLRDTALQVSDDISTTYFTHSGRALFSVGG
jgi:uncharacterized alpha-E superfamily protein